MKIIGDIIREILGGIEKGRPKKWRRRTVGAVPNWDILYDLKEKGRKLKAKTRHRLTNKLNDEEMLQALRNLVEQNRLFYESGKVTLVDWVEGDRASIGYFSNGMRMPFLSRVNINELEMLVRVEF